MTDSTATNIARKPRLFYLDAIRAFATLLIVITHFNNPFMPDKPIFWNTPFRLYIGNLGVGLFLIISGAALTYSHSDKPMHLWSFYKKRLWTLYPMFWIAFIIANIWLFINAHKWIYGDLNKSRILLSIIGFDGYAESAGIHTFYTLGEWFFGFIIIFYAVFPALLYGVKRYPTITIAISLALYIPTILWYEPLTTTWAHKLPLTCLLTARLPELVFGMLFMQYWKHCVRWIASAGIVVLVVQQFTGIISYYNEMFAISCVNISAFSILVVLSTWFDQYFPNPTALRTGIMQVAKYSYPIFLVHHQIIMQVLFVTNVAAMSMLMRYTLFAVLCCAIFVAAVALQAFYGVLQRAMRKMRKSV